MRLARLRGLYRSRFAVVIALVITAVIAGVSVSRLIDDDSLPTADPTTVALARDFAVAVTSFDHETAAQDVAEVLDFGTSGFESEFRDAMGDDFLIGIERSRSVSTGRVIAGPTLQSRVDGSSTFLIVINQSISSEVEGPTSAEGTPEGATSTTTVAATDAPPTPSGTPRLVRVGMLVTVDDASSKVSSVQIL